MFIRLWTTGYDPDRLDELERFAHDTSAPMFRSLDGCLGYSYAHTDAQWVTITYWESEDAIARAEAEEAYQSVVGQITGAGFLEGEQTTFVYELTHTEMFDPN